MLDQQHDGQNVVYLRARVTMIELQVAVTKDDLRRLADCRGKCNAKPFKIGDVTHDARSLVYVGIVANLKDGKYRGVLKFEAANQDVAIDAIDFHGLLTPEEPAKPKRTATKPEPNPGPSIVEPNPSG